MDNQMNRRSFFSSLLKIAGVAVVAPTALSALFSNPAYAQKKRGAPAAGGGAAAGGGSLPFVDSKDPVSKAVKYAEDFKKVPEAKGNHCSTCSFYTKKETVNGKEAGTCTIFAGKLVHGEAWCSSWNKKA